MSHILAAYASICGSFQSSHSRQLQAQAGVQDSDGHAAGSGEQEPNLAQKPVDPESRNSTLEDSLAAATLASTEGQAAETEAQHRPAQTLVQPGAAEAGEVMSPLRPAGEPDFGEGAEPFWQPHAAEAACPGWQQQPGLVVGQEAAFEDGAELLWQPRAAEAACPGWQQRTGLMSGQEAAAASGGSSAAGNLKVEQEAAAASLGSPAAGNVMVEQEAAAASGASPAAGSLCQQAPASPHAMQLRRSRGLDAEPESKASSPLRGEGDGRLPEVAGASLQARSVSIAAAGHAGQSLPQEQTAAAAAEESLLLRQVLAEGAKQSASAPAEAQHSLLPWQAAAEGAEQRTRSDDGNAAGPGAVQSQVCGQAIATDTEQETEAAAGAQQSLLLGQEAAVLAKHGWSQGQPAAEDAEHIALGRPGNPAVSDIEHAWQTAAENAQHGAQARPGSDAALNAQQGLLLGQTAAEDAEAGGLSGPSGLSPGSELNARRHQRDIKVRRRLAEQKAQQQQQLQPARPLHVMAAAAVQQQTAVLSAKGARPASRAASSAPPLLQALAARHGQPEVAQGQAGGLEHRLAPQQAAVGSQQHRPSLQPEALSRAASLVESAPGAGASRPPSSKPSADMGEAEQATHRSSAGPGDTIGRPSSRREAAEPCRTGSASSLRGSQGGSVAGSRSSLQGPQHSSPALEGQTELSAERPEGAASAAMASASVARRAGQLAGHSVVEQQHEDQHVDICHVAAPAAFGRQRPASKVCCAIK